MYTPDERTKNLRSQCLLAKYNCTGCHVVELPQMTFMAKLDEVAATEMTPSDHPAALDMLLKVRPPMQALTGEQKDGGHRRREDGLPPRQVYGFVVSKPILKKKTPNCGNMGLQSGQLLTLELVMTRSDCCLAAA